jgi:hypothetical protein
MKPTQIKTVAADFLRSLATVPGLFERWQAEPSAAARASLVSDQLGLEPALTAADLALVADYAQPLAQARATGQSKSNPVSIIVFSQEQNHGAAGQNPVSIIIYSQDHTHAARKVDCDPVAVVLVTQDHRAAASA